MEASLDVRIGRKELLKINRVRFLELRRLLLKLINSADRTTKAFWRFCGEVDGGIDGCGRDDGCNVCLEAKRVEDMACRLFKTIHDVEVANVSLTDGIKWEDRKKYARKGISRKRRFSVMERDGFRCRYCGVRSTRSRLMVVDHVIPVAKGGSDSPENLVSCCRICNAGKGARMLKIILENGG